MRKPSKQTLSAIRLVEEIFGPAKNITICETSELRPNETDLVDQEFQRQVQAIEREEREREKKEARRKAKESQLGFGL